MTLWFHFSPLWLIADDDSGEKSVSVLLSGEESEMTFIDHAFIEMTVSPMKFMVLTLQISWNDIERLKKWRDFKKLSWNF